jgi:hypothetical protein
MPVKLVWGRGIAATTSRDNNRAIAFRAPTFASFVRRINKDAQCIDLPMTLNFTAPSTRPLRRSAWSTPTVGDTGIGERLQRDRRWPSDCLPVALRLELRRPQGRRWVVAANAGRSVDRSHRPRTRRWSGSRPTSASRARVAEKKPMLP